MSAGVTVKHMLDMPVSIHRAQHVLCDKQQANTIVSRVQLQRCTQLLPCFTYLPLSVSVGLATQITLCTVKQEETTSGQSSFKDRPGMSGICLQAKLSMSSLTVGDGLR